VLDIGAYDGYFSFAAERLGAKRVLATDSWAWGDAPSGSMANFNLAREALGSNVEDRYVDVMDLSPHDLGTFDVVLFLGVLYHLRHPLLALERVAAVAGEALILETLVDMPFVRRPAAAFYPADEINRDATNWWGPNVAAVLAMLRVVGFTDNRVIGRSRRSRLGRAARNLAGVANSRPRPGRTPVPLSDLMTDRLVVQARRR
jgi:tRNA (mo5U34)-methyltransferase